MGKRLATPTVLMDLSKAFDSIDDSMMLAKLFSYGFDCHSVFGLHRIFEINHRLSK